MRFRLYREHGALNSVSVFNAFEQGVKSLGYKVVSDNEDVAVIWSVLWHGRMAANQAIYEKCIREHRPVIIIEVGNLKRNELWRVSLNHINSLGIFGNTEQLDTNRPQKLGVQLRSLSTDRRGEILIATQHESSLQWVGMPTMRAWTENTIAEIKKYTTRRIVVRPHPRSPFPVKIPGVLLDSPRRVPNTYDDFNIFYNYHCVINYNSGPAVQAAIQGVPVICDSSSLAGDLSEKMENIETPILPNRDEWFLKLCHTEWTVDEISQGIPLQRLMPKIIEQIS
jgi:hypothetical protein